jgi:hypothetical protein
MNDDERDDIIDEEICIFTLMPWGEIIAIPLAVVPDGSHWFGTN